MVELAPTNALAYLRSRGWIGAERATVELLAGGVSNIVLRVITPERTLILKQSRPQLRTKDPWFSDLDRVYREQEVMQFLEPLLPALTVPKVLFSDRENYVFAMSHAPAGARVWKGALLAGEVDMTVGERAGRILGLIHQLTAANRQRAHKFRDHTAFVQLRVEPYYQRLPQRHPEAADTVARLVERMLSVKDALCHGDYSPKNILVHERGFMLVDYETAHLGDPTMDLGFFLTHLMLKAVKRHRQRQDFFELTRSFWRGYDREVQFKPTAELQAWGIQHLAVCLLVRVDGTSPVDYLTEEPKREAVRRLAGRIMQEKPAIWEDVLRICDAECSKLD